MINNSRNTFGRTDIQIDVVNQISRVAEQSTKTSLSIRKSSTSPNIASKMQGSYAAELFVNQIVDTSSLFFDTRKQESFDWAKTTNAYQRIIHLSDLEDNWDGYNAPTFSKTQIDRALTLYSFIRTYSINRQLNFSKIEPFIAPSSDGTILFEWGGKRFPHRQLELYVPTKESELFEYLKIEETSNYEGEFILDKLYSILDWLFMFEC